MKLFKLALVLATGFLIPAVASAGTICPSFPGDPVVGTTGCNTLITINSNGTLTFTFPDSTHPYDGSDDNLVGVVNNFGTAVSSLTISNPTTANGGIYGFDGDGIASFTGVGNGSDPSGYGGANAFFTGINGSHTDGTVDFISAIAADGGTSYFSLENPPSGGSFTGTIGGTAPEPGSLLLLGTGVLGVAANLRRRFVK